MRYFVFHSRRVHDVFCYTVYKPELRLSAHSMHDAQRNLAACRHLKSRMAGELSVRK